MRFLLRLVLFIAFFCISADTIAQLCSGSLGDPIVDITFGSGSNPGQPIAASTTNYSFVTDDCPGDGFYTIRNNTNSCFSSSWHSLSSDHTGNGRGYFMLVNASYQPGAFYVDTVRGLCSNTNFEFAAWVVNVLKPSACDNNGNKPNLTFSIETTGGTVLQTYNSGDIPSQFTPVWQQYGFFFNTPPGVSDVVLRIFNNAPGGCGNDLALDDITFRPCGPLVSTSVDGYTIDTITYCELTPQSFVLRASIPPGFANPAYQWQQSTDGLNWTDIPGANAASYTFSVTASTVSDRYHFRLTTAERENFTSRQCRVASSVLLIIRGKKPVVAINVSSPLCEGLPASLTATGGTGYTWTRTDGSLIAVDNPLSIPVLDASLSGKIYVNVENDGVCTAMDSVIISILPKPNATISPAGVNICPGNSTRLTATGGMFYQWQPSQGLSQDNIASPVASPLTSAEYIVTVKDAAGCSDTAHANITVIDRISANAGPDKTIVAGDAVQLNAVTEGDVTYSWSPARYLNDAAILSPVATPPEDIDYILRVTSVAGCGTDADTMHIYVFKDIYVPSAFSPNGDGRNDTWNIPALAAFPDFELFVYNRWGKLVYQCKNTPVPWDGTYNGEPLATGPYVYYIKLNRANRPLMKGNLMLLR